MKKISALSEDKANNRAKPRDAQDVGIIIWDYCVTMINILKEQKENVDNMYKHMGNSAGNDGNDH